LAKFSVLEACAAAPMLLEFEYLMVQMPRFDHLRPLELPVGLLAAERKRVLFPE
jgi:hypothetical protein